MFKSILYHGYGIVGCSYIHADYRKGNCVFTLSRKKISLLGAICKSKRIIKRGFGAFYWPVAIFYMSLYSNLSLW